MPKLGIGNTERWLILVILAMCAGLGLSTSTFLTLPNLFDLLTIVDQAFGHPGVASGKHLVLATYGYAFQLYGDFSGFPPRGWSMSTCGVERPIGMRVHVVCKRRHPGSIGTEESG